MTMRAVPGAGQVGRAKVRGHAVSTLDSFTKIGIADVELSGHRVLKQRWVGELPARLVFKQPLVRPCKPPVL